ncbi:hypothetical protein LJK88_24365 [Paenibacillus sp. P26]|nr:hypothetical protein LJK88_24365 [Paenibacillus sp. P26]UUZ95390.1 hypothetical protein LJK87_13535 [Paenibacillus sp. P25]
MKRLISAKLSSLILMVLNILLLGLHLLILLGIVPYAFVWGGQIHGSSLILFEAAAILITALFLFLVALKAGYIGHGRFRRTTTIGIWVMFAYLLLNTAGNLASQASIETLIFTPVTVIMALLVLRLALER